jgi:hypothetical protein
MSVPKSRRNESKIEFDATYFKVMKDAVELTANHFGASENTYTNSDRTDSTGGCRNKRTRTGI